MRDKLLNIKKLILSQIDKIKAPKSLVNEGVRAKVGRLKKVIIIFAVISVVAWINIGKITEIIISEETLKQDLEEDLSERYSVKLKINGRVLFSTSPEPFIQIENIVIDDEARAPKGKHYATIKKLRAETSLAALFSGSHSLKKVKMEDAVINVNMERGGSNLLYFLKENDLENTKFEVSNLNVNLQRASKVNTGQDIIRSYLVNSFEIDPNPIDGDYIIRGILKTDVSGALNYFALNLDDGIDSDTSYQAKIYSDDTEIILKGNVGISKDIKADADIKGHIGGFTSKLLTSLGDEEMVNELRTNDKTEVSGKLTYNSGKLNSKDLVFSGPIAEYKVALEGDISDKVDLNVKVDIPKLNYSQIFKSREEYLASKTVTELEAEFQQKLSNFFLFSVNDDVNFKFNMKIDEILFSSTPQKGAMIIDADLNDAVFKINDLRLALPGSSLFKVTSKVKINRKDKKLSGSMEFLGYGKNLNILSKSLSKNQEKEESDNLIKDFFVKSKGYIYDQKIHFRELIAQLNQNKLAGQLMIDYSTEFSASSAFTFDSIEIDHYIKPFRKDEKDHYQSNIANRLDFIRVFDSIFDTLNVSISSKNVTKSGVLLDDFSMFATIKPGVMDVRDSFFNTQQTGDFRGRARFDISAFQPKIDLDFDMEKYDVDYIVYGKLNPENDIFLPDGKWSKTRVNLSKLTNIIGKFNFKIDNLKVGHLDLVDFMATLDMQGERVKIEPSRFELFNSKIGFQGIFTTEYPSFNIKYEASELDFQQILGMLFGVRSVSGTFNSSGVLTSTGYTYDELISKLGGRINIVSNGFLVSGFDLSSYSLGLSKIRRVEQVKILSEELLYKGVSEFGYFGTALVITAGKIKFTDTQFLSKVTKEVKASGLIDIHNWKTDITTDIQLTTADNYNVPLSVVASGDMTSREIKWDYSGSKKYWEEKFYGGKIY